MLFCVLAVCGAAAAQDNIAAEVETPEIESDAPASPALIQPRKSEPAAPARKLFDPTLAAKIDAKKLDGAIHAAAGYMIRCCDEKGQFVYQVNLDPNVEVKPSYNIIRHAGAIYALDNYNRRHPSEPARQAMRRAADYLDRHGLAPVSSPGREDMLAVWRLVKAADEAEPKAVVVLGSAGLGATAFAGFRRVAPDAISGDDLRRMAQCLVFMQKDDGSFYGAFDPMKNGLCDQWECLYYPGEAALGLLMVYELSPEPLWRHAAANAITYLAWHRRNDARPPVDHWALLATAKLIAATDADAMRFPRDLWRRHAAAICRRILEDRKTAEPSSPGDLSGVGNLCATACRLEGLLAARTFLQDEDLNREISRAAAEGVNFLLDSQLRGGPCDGAFTHSAPRGKSDANAPSDPKTTEVRIDYVQHALSAMLQCAELIDR